MNLLSSLLKYTADQIAALRAKDTSQDTVVSGINTRLITAEGDIDSLESQFVTVVSAVTTDTEVTNIRVGADGVTYDTAGNSVRGQLNGLRKATSGFVINISDSKGSGDWSWNIPIAINSICRFVNHSSGSCSLSVMDYDGNPTKIKNLVQVDEAVDFICPVDAKQVRGYFNSADQVFTISSDPQTVYTDKLANGAVTTSKIADAAITEAKLDSSLHKKVLGEKTIITSLDSFNKINGIVDYDDTWYQRNNSNYKHVVIPITGTHNSISIKAPSTHNTYIMGVTEAHDPAAGTIPDISEYWVRRIEVVAGYTFEAIIPPDVKYIYVNTLYNQIPCVESIRVECSDFGDSVALEHSDDKLIPITAVAHNVRDFSDGSGDGCPDALVSTNLPLWKTFISGWANADFIAMDEWYKWFDRSGTIDAYNTIFKQFYPYRITMPQLNVNPTKIIMSKYPCFLASLNDISQVKYAMPMLTCFINGKSVAVVCWLMSNTDTVLERQTSYQRAVTALAGYDAVIVMGDFNTEESLDELETWTDAGYTLGNGGYWGTINTWEDTTPNDNIITKGLIFENFEKGDKVTSDHSAVRARLRLTV